MTALDYSLEIRRIRDNGWVPIVKPPRLKDTDLPRIGHKIGVGEDEIHAVIDVEASSGGYDSRGRLLPLYEPHVAYRCASGAVRDRLVAAGLAYPKWKKGYPKDSYPRFEAAFAIDPDVAIKACSWGRAQILGENFAMIGYKSPQEMYVRMANGGEVEHIEAMIRFIIAAGLDDELRNHNWAGFARGYNGPGYKANGYDTKLAARFKWWQGKPDTPWSPDDVTPLPPPVMAELEDIPVAADPDISVAPEPIPDPAPLPVPEPTPVPVPEPTPGPSPAPIDAAVPDAISGTVQEPISQKPTVTAPPRRSLTQWLSDLIDSIFFTRPRV